MKIYKLLNNSFYVLIFTIVLVIVNIALYTFEFELDITRDRANSISSDTKKALKELKGVGNEINVYYFSAVTNDVSLDNYITNKVTMLFNEFRKYNSKINYKIIDLNKESEEVYKNLIIDGKSVLVTSGSRQIIIPIENFVTHINENVRLNLEYELIKGIIKIATNKNSKIYYTDSHGELITTSSFESLRVLLNSYGYELEPINLNTFRPIENEIIFIIAPSTDFTESEISSLEIILDSGCRAFICLDLPDDRVQNELPLFKEFLYSNGIAISNNLLIDQVQDKNLSGLYNEHEITTFIEEFSTSVNMQHSREMRIVDNPYYTASAVVSSFEFARNVNNLYKSYPLLVAFESIDILKSSKLLVSATPYLFANENIKNNKYIISNSINWLEDFETTIVTNPIYDKSIKLNTNSSMYNFIYILIVVIIPFSILILEYNIRRLRMKKI